MEGRLAKAGASLLSLFLLGAQEAPREVGKEHPAPLVWPGVRMGLRWSCNLAETPGGGWYYLEYLLYARVLPVTPRSGKTNQMFAVECMNLSPSASGMTVITCFLPPPQLVGMWKPRLREGQGQSQARLCLAP